MRSMSKNQLQQLFSNPRKLLIFILLTLGAVLVFSPLAIVFFTSVIHPDGGAIAQGVFPASFTWANYQEAWQRGNFLLAFFNSTVVALAVTAFQIITGVLTLNPLAHKTSCKICVSSFWGKTAVSAVFPQAKIT